MRGGELPVSIQHASDQTPAMQVSVPSRDAWWSWDVPLHGGAHPLIQRAGCTECRSFRSQWRREQAADQLLTCEWIVRASVWRRPA